MAMDVKMAQEQQQNNKGSSTTIVDDHQHDEMKPLTAMNGDGSEPHHHKDDDTANGHGKDDNNSASSVLSKWKNHNDGQRQFLLAQGQVMVILVVAYIGNTWPYSYHRNENHSLPCFWFMGLVMLIGGLATMQHRPPRNNRVQLLSRPQTEEWKGWMQWMFIMYHYYRAYPVYNEIRVFVSAYVWMTGFGNFLYFDKTPEGFSVERAVSMWIRINYFPCLLSVCLGVPLELYYVVPLHTTGFFIAMATCYIALQLHQQNRFLPQLTSTKWNCNVIALGLCLVVHIVFYETPLVNALLLFSKEYHFRFQADKYSAWIGMVSGLMWQHFTTYMQWCYGGEETGESSSSSMTVEEKQKARTERRNKMAMCWTQRVCGVGLIGLWYFTYGKESDKFVYNPVHPYIFWIPVAGWLMIRNSSAWLTQIHSRFLEFLGKITLETYVLQFHVFMCHNVQHILVLLPGAGQDGSAVVKFVNMAVIGVGFVALSYWARQVTVTTQTTITDLVTIMIRGSAATTDKTTNATNAAKATAAATDSHRVLKAKNSDLPQSGNFVPPPNMGGRTSDHV